jgi:tetratricopeptide (TPR) repeat protein
MMRVIFYFVFPLLIVCAVLASRFVSWDKLKGPGAEAMKHVKEGMMLLQSGGYRSSVDAFTRAIEESPKYAMAYIRRGRAYHHLGEYQKAIADYDQTLTLKQYEAEAYYGHGDAARALGDYPQAIADYTASLKKRWTAFVMWERAETYREMKETQSAFADYKAVIKHYEAIIKRNSEDSVSYYHRGKAYAQIDKDQLALADFDRAIEIQPNFVEAYLGRGEIYERLEQAETDYLKVITLSSRQIEQLGREHPVLAPVYYRRGYAYERLGQTGKAREDYEKVIALQSESEIARKAMARLASDDFKETGE